MNNINNIYSAQYFICERYGFNSLWCQKPFHFGLANGPNLFYPLVNFNLIFIRDLHRVFHFPLISNH